MLLAEFNKEAVYKALILAECFVRSHMLVGATTCKTPDLLPAHKALTVFKVVVKQEELIKVISLITQHTGQQAVTADNRWISECLQAVDDTTLTAHGLMLTRWLLKL